MTRRRGITLLEILVCVAILVLVTTIVTLSALEPQERSAEASAVHECSIAAIRERRIVTTQLDDGFLVCRPDGRVVAAGIEHLTNTLER